jgi:hypothetical protein
VLSATVRVNGTLAAPSGFAEANVHADARRPVINRPDLVCRSES